MSKPLAVKIQGLSSVFMSGINETLGDNVWGELWGFGFICFMETEQTPLATQYLLIIKLDSTELLSIDF